MVRIEGPGSRVQGSGFRVQGPVFRVQGPGFRVQCSEFRVQDSGFRVQGSGLRVQDSGFRIQGSGFRVQGPGFRVQGSGFRVQGSGIRVQGPGFSVRRSQCRDYGLWIVVYGLILWIMDCGLWVNGLWSRRLRLLNAPGVSFPLSDLSSLFLLSPGFSLSLRSRCLSPLSLSLSFLFSLFPLSGGVVRSVVR